MRAVVRVVCCVFGLTGALAWAAPADRSQWSQVHPRWRRAYVLSFRSPDLLSNEADERWGAEDGRLASGGILTDFPDWLEEHAEAIEDARDAGRPILLSIHTHSGYGAGLTTYSRDLLRAETATYPWLVRELLDAGLGEPDVTVAVDTCNAQATAYYQLRSDLQPAAVAAWAPFKKWRAKDPARRKLSVSDAYRLFAQDHVAAHLRSPAKGKRSNVQALPWGPLAREERRAFRARLYGPRGVILATPAFFNLLRLGPDVSGTLTADLLTGPLRGDHVDGFLARNKGEFRRFTQYGFLAAAGVDLDERWAPERRTAVADSDERERGGRYEDPEPDVRPRRRPLEPSSRNRRD
ncbi:MAG: hypothetical protein ACO1SX_02285 [Actinomycetota bacterium]